MPGAAIVVRTAAFDAVGGFDEQMRFGEDVDLVWRLDDAGWVCRYEPASTVAARATSDAGEPGCANTPGTGRPPHRSALRHPRRARADGVERVDRSRRGRSSRSGIRSPPSSIAVGSSAALIRKLPDVPADCRVRAGDARPHRRRPSRSLTRLRREWWPLVAVGAHVRRDALRWIAAGSRARRRARDCPTDVAYGWGVWRGMRRHRTLAPDRAPPDRLAGPQHHGATTVVGREADDPNRAVAQPRGERGQFGRRASCRS